MDSGCFALTDQAVRPKRLGEISQVEFFAMLCFEERNKLAELG